MSIKEKISINKKTSISENASINLHDVCDTWQPLKGFRVMKKLAHFVIGATILIVAAATIVGIATADLRTVDEALAQTVVPFKWTIERICKDRDAACVSEQAYQIRRVVLMRQELTDDQIAVLDECENQYALKDWRQVRACFDRRPGGKS